MNLEKEANRVLDFALREANFSAVSAQKKRDFLARMKQHFEDLYALLYEVYGTRADFVFQVDKLIQTLIEGYIKRDKALIQQDKSCLVNGPWYNSQGVVGMAAYVDLFAGSISGLIERIDYLKSLGITYLHLMPLYSVPEGDNDGGYAVSDYRKVNPTLGDMKELLSLRKALTKAGIHLVLDFVFNHTSDQHQWAQKAKENDYKYQEFYLMFDDFAETQQYEQSLREIFPQVRRGNFTFNNESKKWVWTTFNSFQWDLNYSNPDVFNAITSEMLFLANIGCSALRLDALAFIWKEKGTNCENQPRAHTLIRAFNTCLKIVAPSVVFKSEAIVHPSEVIKYIDEDECQISYNPLLMALLWNSLATRKTNLITRSLNSSFRIPDNTSWVNYLRCHDDIGWTFDDEIAHKVGVDGYNHRVFLNRFYTGKFEGSFASGVAFAENPTTGDCRVCGSLASLAGLEKAKLEGDAVAIEHSIKRIIMLHSIIFSIGGIPLLYSGDELGLTNDYSYKANPKHAHDDRWVHRIAVGDETITNVLKNGTPENRVFSAISEMIAVRKAHSVLGKADTQFLDTQNHHVFAFLRVCESGDRFLHINNFSEHVVSISGAIIAQLGFGEQLDFLSGEKHSVNEDIYLDAYQVRWFLQDKSM